MPAYPYKREIRPSLQESLGEHTDREFEKIERSIGSILEEGVGGGTVGPEGPEGPIGPEGPEGPQGPAGEDGADGSIPSGSTFPTTPIDNERFHRTDLDMEFYWNASLSRWLTTNLYVSPVSSFANAGGTFGTYKALHNPAVFQTFIERIDVTTFSTGTPWVVTLDWVSVSNSPTNISTLGPTGSGGSWVQQSASPNFMVPTTAANISVTYTAGSGVLFGNSTLAFRLAAI